MSHPTHHDYEISKRISAEDYPFYALLCALIRQADNNNLDRIALMFPDEVSLFTERYRNPGGLSNAELERLKRDASLTAATAAHPEGIES